MSKIKGGYYIKARCIQNSEIAHAAPYVREIWDWLIKEANHKDTKTCKRGQCIRTYQDIQEGLSWFVGWRKETYKKSDCENAMKWLRKHTMIATQKTTRGMIITIVNYDKYQLSDSYEATPITTPITTLVPQTSHTINKNVKNEKNVNNMQPAVADEINPIFDVFYQVNKTLNYGNKTQRKAVSDLLEKYGLDKTLAAAHYALSVLGKQYAPQITNPLQLKDKFTQLAAFKIQQGETRKVIKA